jgi:hypothetical protein
MLYNCALLHICAVTQRGNRTDLRSPGHLYVARFPGAPNVLRSRKCAPRCGGVLLRQQPGEIFGTLRGDLHHLDFSLLLPDVMTIAHEVDSQLTPSMGSYMKSYTGQRQRSLQNF